ncbi:hypothetical protein ACOCGH_001324 [Vibrio cholerae]
MKKDVAYLATPAELKALYEHGANIGDWVKNIIDGKVHGGATLTHIKNWLKELENKNENYKQN